MLRYIILLLPMIVFAKPVKIDEILTEKNSFKVDQTMTYINIKKDESSLAPVMYQTQGGDFITIPTYLGDKKSNQDYLNYNIALRYGVSKDFEIFANANAFMTNTKYQDGTNMSSKSDSDFGSFGVGATYQIKNEDDTPSLLVGGSVDLVEKTKFSQTSKSNHFKGYSVFATSYYTVDPIVFLLKSSYRINQKKEYNNESLDAGNQFNLSPQIYFTANPYTSLNAGITYAYTWESKMNNEFVSAGGSNISYNFGVGYELNPKTTINLDAEYSNQLDMSQSSLSFGLNYKFY
ncbi:MAG: hypothetical protein KN64_05020 [Sulfurovum sp. AS07-7]|nr:MAG: hypothetical protein KN64_05020 [Sulfurovum sp. AS07-7]